MAELSGLQSVQANHEKYAHLFESSETNDTVSTDTFFSLLMAEMSNQDPLEPMSNTEFVSQMAQFTALQAQKENLTYSMSNYAAGLVGKTLTVNAQNEDGTLVSGLCTGMSINGSDVKVTVNGAQYEISAIKAVGEAEKTETPDLSSAVQLIGKYVTVNVLGDDGEYYYTAGNVEAAEIKNGEPMIVIDGYLYRLSEVISVGSEPPQSEETTDSSTPDEITELMEMLGR